MRKLVSAVSHMHDVGVVHRDLKPEVLDVYLRSSSATVEILFLSEHTLYLCDEQSGSQTFERELLCFCELCMIGHIVTLTLQSATKQD